MRIAGGELRGRPLICPSGITTRPTGDRARQAVFNILAHAAWMPPNFFETARVLDAFAGTGALGIEALSRGALECTFFENNREAAAACLKNIETLGLNTKARLLSVDATKCGRLEDANKKRNLIFLDPPYHKNLCFLTLAHLEKQNWIADEAVVVMEMAKKTPEPFPKDGLHSWRLMDTRNYGVAEVRFLTNK